MCSENHIHARLKNQPTGLNSLAHHAASACPFSISGACDDESLTVAEVLPLRLKHKPKTLILKQSPTCVRLVQPLLAITYVTLYLWKLISLVQSVYYQQRMTPVGTPLCTCGSMAVHDNH